MTDPRSPGALLDENALHYHRYPRPGKLEVQPTKPIGNQRDLALAYSPGVAEPACAIAADPGGRRLHRARQPRRGDLQRHGGARARRHRRARRQAGDGGQGGALQEVRRHRRLRHRGGRDRHRSSSSRSSPRSSRPSAASTSRTSRRRSASTSSAAARADEDPRLPRRPARHRDHRRRRDGQRAGVAGKRIEDVKIVTSAPAPRRSPASTCWCSLGARRENIWVTDIEGWSMPAGRRSWTAGRRPTRRRPLRAGSPR